MSIEFEEMPPPGKADVQQARKVVARLMVVGILKLPPELAVELGNIDRCLKIALGTFERDDEPTVKTGGSGNS